MTSMNCNAISRIQHHSKLYSDDIKLDFSDVLLLPNTSDYLSRKEANISVSLNFKNSNKTIDCVPVAAANMHGVGTFSMATEISERHNFLTFLHKHYSINDYVQFYEKHRKTNIFYTLGSSIEDYTKLCSVADNIRTTINSICIDVANGHTTNTLDAVRRCRKRFPDAIIAAGNIATTDMVHQYADAGADILKFGIGSGACCTTRSKTGIGYPQFSLILDVIDTARKHGMRVISDGGCNCPGDICKALVAGADIVMIGGMLAGHTESETEIMENESGHKQMIIYGMSSKHAMLKTHGNVSDYKTPEGRVCHVDYRGNVSETIKDITGGLRSFMTYTGIESLSDSFEKVRYIKVNNQLNRMFH